MTLQELIRAMQELIKARIKFARTRQVCKERGQHSCEGNTVKQYLENIHFSKDLRSRARLKCNIKVHKHVGLKDVAKILRIGRVPKQKI